MRTKIQMPILHQKENLKKNESLLQTLNKLMSLNNSFNIKVGRCNVICFHLNKMQFLPTIIGILF